MANQKLFELTSADGTEFYIEYNDVNLRIGNVSFTVPQGLSFLVRLWESGNLVYDSIYGEGFHSENIPGNYQLVEYTNPWGEQDFYPPPISWSISEIRT